MTNKTVPKNVQKRSSKKSTKGTGTAARPPVDATLTKALAAYFGLTPENQEKFLTTIRSSGTVATNDSRPTPDGGRKSDNPVKRSRKKSSKKRTKTEGSETGPSQSSSSQVTNEDNERRAALVARLKVVRNNDGQTVCKSGPEAHEIQMELAGETGKGTKKTIKRRIQQLKKELKAMSLDDEGRSSLEAKIDRSKTRLANLETTGESGHHVNVITDVKAVGEGTDATRAVATLQGSQAANPSDGRDVQMNVSSIRGTTAVSQTVAKAVPRNGRSGSLGPD
jgi:hypothetical protein